MEDTKHKALQKRSIEGKKFSFHDLRSNRHRDVDYTEVRSALKKSYPKSRVHRKVREMAQNLKPNTAEAIPAHGGYYSRTK